MSETKRAPRVVVCTGTRPEQIKMAPVCAALRERGAEVVEWCSGQSRDFMEPTIEHMKTNGSLEALIASTLDWFRPGEVERADAVLVQGDTATAFACALAAFLAGVPVGHVEAGLRTYQREPWPEEAFRRMIAPLATWHFCPDEDARANILHEGCPRGGSANAYVTGNPIIDTLPPAPFRVLATLHRRENWGTRLFSAIDALEGFAAENENVRVRLVRHPNWTKALTVEPLNREDIDFWVLRPLPHSALLEHIAEASVVVTDSGGLQEEAAHLGVPCLVVRSATERVALQRNGAITLIDPDQPQVLRAALDALLARRQAYGEGRAGERIVEILMRELEANHKEAA